MPCSINVVSTTANTPSTIVARKWTFAGRASASASGSRDDCTENERRTEWQGADCGHRDGDDDSQTIVPGAASSVTRSQRPRKVVRSMLHVASKISGGRKMKNSEGPKAKGGCICQRDPNVVPTATTAPLPECASVRP